MYVESYVKMGLKGLWGSRHPGSGSGSRVPSPVPFSLSSAARCPVFCSLFVLEGGEEVQGNDFKKAATGKPRFRCAGWILASKSQSDSWLCIQ